MKYTKLNEIDFFLNKIIKKRKMKKFLSSLKIKKGTKFYRIRKEIKGDFNDIKEWEICPKKYLKQGRFNNHKQGVLYCCSTEYLALKETGVKEDEEYFLGEYEAIEDFEVASLINPIYDENLAAIHCLCMAIETDSKITDEEIKLRDEYINLVYLDKNEEPLKYDPIVSLFIHKMLSKNLYSYTNKIFNIIKEIFPYGLRYCSSFEPLEMSGCIPAITLAGEEHGNFAFTKKGKSKLKFVKAEKKISKENLPSLCLFLEYSIERERNTT